MGSRKKTNWTAAECQEHAQECLGDESEFLEEVRVPARLTVVIGRV